MFTGSRRHTHGLVMPMYARNKSSLSFSIISAIKRQLIDTNDFPVLWNPFLSDLIDDFQYGWKLICSKHIKFPMYLIGNIRFEMMYSYSNTQGWHLETKQHKYQPTLAAYFTQSTTDLNELHCNWVECICTLWLNYHHFDLYAPAKIAMRNEIND